LGIPHEAFEKKLNIIKLNAGVKNDIDLNEEELKKLCDEYLSVYREFNATFPEDPLEQLRQCILAVFKSWNCPRAIKYRELNNIRDLKGTAVNVQVVVHGNIGWNSGTGVAFSRNPSTGIKELYGEYLINAQGEDVVAGIRTPQPIATMKEQLPSAYEEFLQSVDILERHFKDMQDVEFTVENGRLWMLQCRNGKRTGQAALQIAVDLVNEGLCSREQALLKIEPEHIRQLLHPFFQPEALKSLLYTNNVITKGLPAGPGAAVGKVVFSPKEAEDCQKNGENCILAREITSPEDVGGMWAAKGILTARGGMTSHAAVVCRGWGKTCICGCDDLHVDEDSGTITIISTGDKIHRGDVISLNGNTGEVIKAPIAVVDSVVDGHFSDVLGWADDAARLSVYANADSPQDALKSIEFGAKGIGLCRTEHMFFAPNRLAVVRRWILKDEGIDELKSFQRADFGGIFNALAGFPCTIRLLDPPLHEFLPKLESIDDKMAHTLGFDGHIHELIDKINQLHEENPMLGLRGCRLGIVHPQITEMQVDAIMNAAFDSYESTGICPRPRIMIPLIGHVNELLNQVQIIKTVAEQVKRERAKGDMLIPYEIGTMIEVPRAALLSKQIASLESIGSDKSKVIDFFSYGTNDLTQMTMGISRDDSNDFIPYYLKTGIFKEDPFKCIDEEGVGLLLKMSAESARAAHPNICLSVCGEHGGDPTSIAFFHNVGLDYVSCSPFRVPLARLAAGRVSASEHLQGQSHPDDIVEFAMPESQIRQKSYSVCVNNVESGWSASPMKRSISA
jgi:pyruvate,orthophosphate dikinase